MSNMKEKLTEMGYTDYQIECILDVEASGLDVSVFAEYLYEPAQTMILLRAIENDFDISVIKIPSFNSQTMNLIYSALEARIPLTFVNPILTFAQMSTEYTILYNKYHHIYKTLKSFLPEDDNEYVDHLLAKIYKQSDLQDKCKLYQYALMLADKLDMSLVLADDYDWRQIEQIRLGMIDKVDVALYANPEYDWETMRVVRMAAFDMINLINYVKEGYSPFQLEAIRIAINNGITPESFIKIDMTASEVSDALIKQKHILELSKNI